MSEIQCFYGKISNTLYFAKVNQDVELVILMPAKNLLQEFLNLEYKCLLFVGIYVCVCLCLSWTVLRSISLGYTSRVFTVQLGNLLLHADEICPTCACV